MRRSYMIAIVLAASVAVLGACSGAANNGTVTKPNTVATPAPVSTASPSPSPSVSPVKPGASPEVKKTDVKKTDDKKSTDVKKKPDPGALGNDANPAKTPKTK